MADIITKYKVFIASPNGLEGERRIFYEEISNYDEIHGPPMGVGFKAMSSDITVAGYGRPQSIINEDLYLCDYYVLILWDRWGSPPDKPESTTYTSGSEEEFREACRCKKDKNLPMRDIIVMFKQLNNKRLKNPDEQLSRVLDFKRELEEKRILLFKNFKNRTIFRREVQKCLSKWAIEHQRRIIKPELKDVRKFWTPE